MLRLVPLQNDYPQADPSLLIYTVVDRIVAPGRLPTERGVLLMDAAAAVAIGQGMLRNEPMVRVPMSFYHGLRPGSRLGGSGGLRTLASAVVGTPLRDMLLQLGISAGGADLCGSLPMRALPLSMATIASGGETGACILPRAADVNPSPCIRCGWCVEGCPTRINPAGLLSWPRRQT